MSKNKMCPKFLIFVFFSHVQKNTKNFLKILYQYLPSSTISPYFNSSYYSFLTFWTLYPIFFQYISKKISPKSQWGEVLTPKTPPCLCLCIQPSVHRSIQP